jgi:hypothetical protein
VAAAGVDVHVDVVQGASSQMRLDHKRRSDEKTYTEGSDSLREDHSAPLVMLPLQLGLRRLFHRTPFLRHRAQACCDGPARRPTLWLVRAWWPRWSLHTSLSSIFCDLTITSDQHDLAATMNVTSLDRATSFWGIRRFLGRIWRCHCIYADLKRIRESTRLVQLGWIHLYPDVL